MTLIFSPLSRCLIFSRMYDMNKESGRRNAVADLSLFHSIQMKDAKGIQF